jgi:hypothetical protein
MQIPLEFNDLKKTKLMASCVPRDFLVVAFVQLNDPISREGKSPGFRRRRNGSEHCGHPDRTIRSWQLRRASDPETMGLR